MLPQRPTGGWGTSNRDGATHPLLLPQPVRRQAQCRIATAELPEFRCSVCLLFCWCRYVQARGWRDPAAAQLPVRRCSWWEPIACVPLVAARVGPRSTISASVAGRGKGDLLPLLLTAARAWMLLVVAACSARLAPQFACCLVYPHTRTHAHTHTHTHKRAQTHKHPQTCLLCTENSQIREFKRGQSRLTLLGVGPWRYKAKAPCGPVDPLTGQRAQ